MVALLSGLKLVSSARLAFTTLDHHHQSSLCRQMHKVFMLYYCSLNCVKISSLWTSLSIGHVRCINIPTWAWSFRVKIVNFSSLFCLSIPKKDLNTKKTSPNLEVCSGSPRTMLEYWYIECGLLHYAVT